MTPRQIKRGQADLRHQNRKQRLKQLKKEARIREGTGEPGTIAAVFGAECLVQGSHGVERYRSLEGLAIGDNVLVENRTIQRALPRRTVLSRPDPFNPGKERVLASNIDLVIVVVCVGTPPLRPRLIDRVLIAAARGGVDVVVCVNKCDLGLTKEDSQAVSQYRELSLGFIFCSSITGQGLDELRTAMRGRTCVFTGHSGVGKSSLVNALCPDLNLETGNVGRKGRHTTASSSLHVLPDGTKLIDTPGIREFGLWRIGPEDLRRYFAEFAAFPCAYRDCTHTCEPGCAVRDAGLPRYPIYLRLLGSL